MRKLIITAVGGAAVAAGVVLAAPAQAAPCAWFGSNPSKSICGVPSVSGTIQNAQTNLSTNFNPQTALNNLQYNLTHGVGSAG